MELSSLFAARRGQQGRKKTWLLLLGTGPSAPCTQGKKWSREGAEAEGKLQGGGAMGRSGARAPAMEESRASACSQGTRPWLDSATKEKERAGGAMGSSK
jgi:hypothetical protein